MFLSTIQACIEDNLDMVEFLVKHGADINVKIMKVGRRYMRHHHAGKIEVAFLSTNLYEIDYF